jgi:hypothetical protein
MMGDEKKKLLKTLDCFIGYAEATKKFHDLDFYIKLKEFLTREKDDAKGNNF